MPVLTDIRNGYLRNTTTYYINDDPIEVIIMRATKVRKPGGGHDFPKVALDPQTFRFVNQDITSGISTTSDDGEIHKASYVMVGNWDADIQVDDTWTDDVIQYKIESIIPNNGWESRCYVTGFSAKPEHG